MILIDIHSRIGILELIEIRKKLYRNILKNIDILTFPSYNRKKSFRGGRANMNNHHKSYKDNMKQRAMKKKQEQETFELELYAQLILDEAVFTFQEERYQKTIDQALDQRNEKAFQEASRQYVAFLRSYKQELHFD